MKKKIRLTGKKKTKQTKKKNKKKKAPSPLYP